MIGLKLDKKYRTLSGKICLHRQGLLNDPSPEKKPWLIWIIIPKRSLTITSSYQKTQKNERSQIMIRVDIFQFEDLWNVIILGDLSPSGKLKDDRKHLELRRWCHCLWAPCKLQPQQNTDNRRVEAKKWWKIHKSSWAGFNRNLTNKGSPWTEANILSSKGAFEQK